MRSPMVHQFSQVPTASIQRSMFERSCAHKTTFDSGYLVPVFFDLAYPGDTFALRMSAFARISATALLRPPMDNLRLTSFFFSIPIRLVWDNFKKFMGEQASPGDSTSYTIPQMTGPNVAAGGIAIGSLSDYFGIPTGALSGGGGTTGITFNSWFHRAYNLCYREWFRDQNLQNTVVVDVDDGPDTYTDYVLLKRGKRHDYFTSCLPWPQKGTAVTLPLGTSATVKTNATDLLSGAGNAMTFLESDGSGLDADVLLTAGTSNRIAATAVAGTSVGNFLYPANLYADLSTATAATVNALRAAFQLQKMYERDARGGTRYVELVKSHFQVDSLDLRPTRPEYLGGGESLINVHPVASTNAVGTGATAAGQLTAFATGAIGGHGFSKSFTEHCLVLGLVCVTADLTYQQGINKLFNLRTRDDMYWPSYAHLGEEAVLNREIYADVPDGTSSVQKDGVFGYQERYAYMRYKPSMITGKFRSTASGTLDVYHLAQKFTSLPTLGDTFIKESPPIDRIVAVNTEPQILFDSFFSYRCARPMPVYSVPGLIDHF